METYSKETTNNKKPNISGDNKHQFNAISANALFHFTNTLDHLLNILTKNFCPRISMEDQTSFGHITEGYPMVCFCDLPLSQMRRHINFYGNYGIGLKKEWGIKNGLNPVLYLSPDSILLKSIQDIPGVSNSKWIFDSSHRILTYMKPYQGRFEHNNEVINNYRFYDEREWRYVLNNSQLEAKTRLLIFNQEEDIEKCNQQIENLGCRLEFEPSDINYLILKNDDEIEKFIDKVKRIKSKYSPIMREVLTSKITTVERINEDF